MSREKEIDFIVSMLIAELREFQKEKKEYNDFKIIDRGNDNRFIRRRGRRSMNGGELRSKIYEFFKMTEEEKMIWNEKSVSVLIDLLLEQAEILRSNYEKEKHRGN